MDFSHNCSQQSEVCKNMIHDNDLDTENYQLENSE